MMAVEIVKPGTKEPDADLTKKVAGLSNSEGVVTLTAGTYGNVLRFLPPLVIDDALLGEGLVGLRVHGLWAGLDVDPALGTGRDLCEALAERGVLVKDTHGSTIRISPPLTIERDDLVWGLTQVREVVADLRAALG